jgi:hypothetical protein
MAMIQQQIETVNNLTRICADNMAFLSNLGMRGKSTLNVAAR